MLFNSFEFLIFFPVVTFLYFLLPHKYRWLMLLMASCIFYMAFIPIYILVLAVLILIDYAMGILIEKSEDSKRKIFLVVSIFSTCFVLFIFKYFGFFNVNLTNLAHFIGWNYSLKTLSLILPIGLSFHTFQSLSYVIEVYRKKQKAERNLGIYALYVMFYPQLVAGPIERPYNMIHQFYEKHEFNYKEVVDGLKLMLWGMFKKVVIADRLALFVSVVYSNPAGHEGISFIVATIFFTFQIYCDFSGYSDIAIGAAKVMGFKLMQNFNLPFFAKSIPEYWKRWHISLSTWFKDYVYIPMGGSRVSKLRWYFNILSVFLISGFWHGAAWTFIVWGALHGIYYMLGSMTENFRKIIVKIIRLDKIPKIHKCIQSIITFSLVSFSLIFFRAKSISDAFYISAHLFSGVADFFAVAFNSLINLDIGKGVFSPILLGQTPIFFLNAVIFIIFLVFAETVQFMTGQESIIAALEKKPAWIRWTGYYLLIIILLFFGIFDKAGQFIYFQF